jgi:predicted metalloendopeptidase
MAIYSTSAIKSSLFNYLISLSNDNLQKLKIKSDTWMENVIEMLSWQFMLKLSRFRLKNELEWALAPTEVNAFHTFQSVAISNFR